MGGIIASIITGSMLAYASYSTDLSWLAKFIRVPSSVHEFVQGKIQLAGTGESSERWISRTLQLSAATLVFACLAGMSVVFSVMLSAFVILIRWIELSRSVRARERKLERNLPLAFEMAAMLLQAGLDLNSVVDRLSKGRDASAHEMMWLRKMLQAGVSKGEATRRLAARWPRVSLLQSFARCVGYRERFGSGLAKSMMALARQAREERWRRAEKAGVIASQKMLIPLVLFIMPTTLLIVFGPIVIRLLNGELF